MRLVSGTFALYMALGTWGGEGLSRNLAWRRLAYALAALVIGGAIGAIQDVPVAEYVAWSPRSGGLPAYELATSYSMPPEEFINAYLPQFSGILFSYWGRNGIHFHSDYLGATVLILAVAAFGGSVPSAGKRFCWVWCAVLGGHSSLALGGFTPLLSLGC